MNMTDNPLLSIFGFIGTYYGIVIPLLIILVLTLIYTASLLYPGSKPKAIGEAIYTYLLHAISVLLMTIGALPTVYSVFAGISYKGSMYVALLLVFACGGLLFLIQDQAVRNLETASKAVVESIYILTLKIIGNILTLLAALSILVSIILSDYEKGWWVTPFVLLLYGMLLSWATRPDVEKKAFHAAPMTVAAKAQSSTSKKAAKKKKR